jgi:hypothetical protein
MVMCILGVLKRISRLADSDLAFGEYSSSSYASIKSANLMTFFLFPGSRGWKLWHLIGTYNLDVTVSTRVLLKGDVCTIP